MVRAARSSHSHAYDRFRVLLGVTIAHELVHCFMTYLFDGDEDCITPTDIMGREFLNPDYGNLGAMWEFQVLGGKFMTYAEPDHALAENQPGMVWLNKLDGYVEKLIISKERVDGHGMFDMLTLLL